MQNLILLHGALGSGEDFQDLIHQLKSFEIKLHVVNFSGHGSTSFQSEFGIIQFSKELENYIVENKIDRPSIFGYSMGGYVALHLAEKNPEIIGKIITLGTKFDWNSEFVANETKMLHPEVLLEKVPALAKSLENKHGSSWKVLLEKTAEMMKDLAKQDLLNSEKLKSIQVPVLLGIADKDRMVRLDETIKVFHTIPNSAMYMLPKSKHQLETVNTEILNKIIFEFIQIAD